MSTKKENKKTTEATKSAEPAPKNILPVGKNGAQIPCGYYIKQDDGSLVKCDSDEVLKHNTSLVTIKSGDDPTETYAMCWHKSESHYRIAILTSKKMSGDKTDINGTKVDLVGRGEYSRAMFALHSCWRAFAEGLGVADACSLVQVKLLFKEKMWEGVFAPVTDIVG